MEPTTTHVSHSIVSGLTVRTTNRDEFNPETAKIPTLWSRFFSSDIPDKIPNRLPDAPFLGVYSAYESDASGPYDITAGVTVTTLNPDFSNIEIQEGSYLVFEAIGPMPAAVIQTWTSVWTYFEQHPHVKRSFLTDFELYCGPEKVQIHIGVES